MEYKAYSYLLELCLQNYTQQQQSMYSHYFYKIKDFDKNIV